MALTAQSLFLFGFQVDETNRNIDFRVVAAETPRLAQLRLGFYSLSGLLDEIERAMHEQATTVTFTASADRTISGGTENRVTIAASSAVLELLFATGPGSASSVAPLIGFPATDHTGATTYTGTSTAGTALIPERTAYNYLGPEFHREVFGSVNVSASGLKEAVVWQIQKFIQAQFKHEPQAKVISEWMDFMEWAIQQRPFDFTPEVTSPTVFYDVTLEKTSADGKGLGYMIREMLPQFPFDYDTGLLTMRQKNE